MLPPVNAHGRGGAPHRRMLLSAPRFRARSPLGAPPRLWPILAGRFGFHPEALRLRAKVFWGHVSCDLVAAGYELARRFLSQSSSSTLRAGRSAGRPDAQSRPSAACEAARGAALNPVSGSHPDASPRWVEASLQIGILSAESRTVFSEAIWPISL